MTAQRRARSMTSPGSGPSRAQLAPADLDAFYGDGVRRDAHTGGSDDQPVGTADGKGIVMRQEGLRHDVCARGKRV